MANRSVAIAGGVAVRGMGSMGWELGGKVVDIDEGGTVTLLSKPTVVRGIYTGKRPTGRHNFVLENGNMGVIVGARASIGQYTMGMRFV